MMLREKKNLIQPQETYTGSEVTYRLLCYYDQKCVFAKKKDDCIITIQLKIGRKRTAKCIIIKVNYAIQDAFERRQV
jgi:hypothetical protein